MQNPVVILNPLGFQDPWDSSHFGFPMAIGVGILSVVLIHWAEEAIFDIALWLRGSLPKAF